MAITYTRNYWTKGDVLTAEKLNSTEQTLTTVVNQINGTVQDEQGNTTALDPTLAIATKAYVTGEIGKLDYYNLKPDGMTQEAFEELASTPTNLKTIQEIHEANGIIDVTFQEIGRANGSGNSATLGIVKAGTNLTANNGILSTINNPQFTGGITVDGSAIFNELIANGPTTISDGLSVSGHTTFINGITVGSVTTPTGGDPTVSTNDIELYIRNFIIGTNQSTPSNKNTHTYIYGSTDIEGTITIGKATTTVENDVSTTTYSGTAIFNTTANTLHGATTIDDLTIGVVKGALTVRDSFIHPAKFVEVDNTPVLQPNGIFTGSYETIQLGETSGGKGTEIFLSGTSTHIATDTVEISGNLTVIDGMTLINSTRTSSYYIGVDSSNSFILKESSAAEGNNIFKYSKSGTGINEVINIEFSGDLYASGDVYSGGIHSTITEPTTSSELAQLVETAGYNTTVNNTEQYVYLRQLYANGDEMIKGILTVNTDTVIDTGIKLNNRASSGSQNTYGYEINTDNFGFYISSKVVGQNSGRSLLYYHPTEDAVTIGSFLNNIQNAVNTAFIRATTTISLTTGDAGQVVVGSNLSIYEKNIIFHKNNQQYALTAEDIDHLHTLWDNSQA